MSNVPFIEYVNSPLFRLTSAETVDVDGHDCIEVKFEMKYPSDIPPGLGTVVLDPDLGWAIRREELGGGIMPGLATSHEVEYEEIRNGLPIPSVVKENGTGQGVRLWKVKEFTFESTPDEQFTLEYYGIPDPDAGEEAPAIERRGTNWLVWIIGAGVVGLILAAVLRRLGRR